MTRKIKNATGEESGQPVESVASFEARLQELEQIVRQLEAGDLPLERSLELFEQGVRLSRDCQKRLTDAESKVEVLLRDEQGALSKADFEEPAG